MTNIMASSPTGAGPCSDAEWQVRADLALAYRLVDHFGMTDLIHTHISVRVPDEEGHFLQLPYGHLFGEARASDMVKCDVAGGIISDPTGLGISLGGFCIHSAIHMGTPRAACVMHAHTEATIAVSNYRDGLLPLSQHALRFYGRVGYLDYCGAFDTQAKRDALPQALGDGDVLMLRNHGPLVIGASVAECFSRLYYLERACRIQIATLSACRDTARELVWPSEADCAFMSRAFQGGESVIAREWNALKRLIEAGEMDRVVPSP
ncbi:class II aldolase/adducin family protein [Sphingobium nicotianae]|uniref:Class II aldolase/adducin family protein n=1 Tax=Sphingobium nicotianae TaxID=2782607 RepID=A0A9X1DDM5_9SPHN|nr:class II aldolase/adducin family protein [Sphingobium nicotianae]MBT2188290.1 class II aldolase/adducin family protein [Sphingobium nicotianae]